MKHFVLLLTLLFPVATFAQADLSKGIEPSLGNNAELNIPSVTREDMQNAPELKQLQSLRGKKGVTISEDMKNLRLKAVTEVGERIGFQEGYNWRYRQIDALMKRRELALDAIFDFGPFLLEDGKVMPPVITSADSFMEIRNPDEMIATGKTYKILKPARFITVQPSWRDYLVVPENAIRTEKIHPSTLPMTSDEQKAWKEAVSEQWINGIEHADKMFEMGVNKLLVDLRGLIQYKVLADRGYISMPKIAKGHLAIRVGDENLEFDQQTFRITEKARFRNIDKAHSSLEKKKPVKKR